MTGESPEQPNRNTAEEEANLALRDAEWAEGAGLPERAVTAYRRVVALFPAVWEVHNNLANLLLDLGRPAEALESAQAARALRPEDPLVNGNMGRALLRLDRPGRRHPVSAHGAAGESRRTRTARHAGAGISRRRPAGRRRRGLCRGRRTGRQ